MEQLLLKVEDLTIEFYDHDVPERVVNHLNMELRQGEILGIVGESGSGKSMTAMAIAGLLRRHDMKMQGKILFEEGNFCMKIERCFDRFRAMRLVLYFKNL